MMRNEKKKFLFYYSLFMSIVFVMLDLTLVYNGDKVECSNYHGLNESIIQSFIICGSICGAIQIICSVLYFTKSNYSEFLSIINYTLIFAINFVNIIQLIVYAAKNKECVSDEYLFELMIIFTGIYTLLSAIISGIVSCKIFCG